MKRDLDAVASETFDLIVVRGGIIAAGITRGAAPKASVPCFQRRMISPPPRPLALPGSLTGASDTCGGLSSVWCVKDMIDLEDVRR